MCLASIDGEVCGMRLAPVPVASPVECQRLAAMIMRADPMYRLPLLCTRRRPNLPVMAAPVPAERWS